MSRRLTQGQRRSVACPTCGRGAGRSCVSSRTPGPNTLGGGWGGPPDLNREHKARVTFARAKLAKATALVAEAGPHVTADPDVEYITADPGLVALCRGHADQDSRAAARKGAILPITISPDERIFTFTGRLQLRVHPEVVEAGPVDRAIPASFRSTATTAMKPGTVKVTFSGPALETFHVFLTEAAPGGGPLWTHPNLQRELRRFVGTRCEERGGTSGLARCTQVQGHMGGHTPTYDNVTVTN